MALVVDYGIWYVWCLKNLIKTYFNVKIIIKKILKYIKI